MEEQAGIFDSFWYLATPASAGVALSIQKKGDNTKLVAYEGRYKGQYNDKRK
jgi:hypothetical protein